MCVYITICIYLRAHVVPCAPSRLLQHARCNQRMSKSNSARHAPPAWHHRNYQKVSCSWIEEQTDFLRISLMSCGSIQEQFAGGPEKWNSQNISLLLNSHDYRAAVWEFLLVVLDSHAIQEILRSQPANEDSTYRVAMMHRIPYKLQIFSRQKASDSRALLRKMSCKNKVSYDSACKITVKLTFRNVYRLCSTVCGVLHCGAECCSVL